MANHWYGISEKEKEEIAEKALRLTKEGSVLEEPEIQSPANGVEGQEKVQKDNVERREDAGKAET